MPIIRMSAAEQFGVPLDGKDPESLEIPGIVRLMRQYSIGGVIVEYFGGIPLDITPPYFEGGFKYSLRLDDPENGSVDCIPNTVDPIAAEIKPEGVELISNPSIKVGLDAAPHFVIQGPSPRYEGECIHELISYLPLSFLLRE